MTHDVIFETVKRNVLAVLPDVEPGQISIDGKLSDLGANSVDRADVVTLTMEDLGVTIPITEFQDVSDLRSLVTVLEKHA
ncbi:hypothetical protein J5X84_01915 [Streptosporangiaceae bacterium NEAU-GS5]|nr:hypothetical protein [Streptosporangiaceae bacterium NEAU-GS5]